MPVQTPPLGAASPVDAGALKTDNCLSTFLLAHLGQAIVSRVDWTMVSNRWSQLRQVYSNIGISPRFAGNSNISNSDHPRLGVFGFGLGAFGGDAQRMLPRDRH